MASFLEKYEKTAGITPPAPAPAPTAPVKEPGILEKIGNFFSGKPAAPAAPVAPAPTRTSAIESYEKSAGIVPKSTPEEAKKASMASFLDTTDPKLRTLGEQTRTLAMTTTTPSMPRPLVTPDQQSTLDDPAVATQYVQGLKDQQPKSLVEKLGDGWKAYSNFVNRFSENIAIGELSTVESFLGAVQWLAPKAAKTPGIGLGIPGVKVPGQEKAGEMLGDKAGQAADRLGAWLDEVNKQQGDQTFTDKLTQGIGSSAIFFIPGLGVAKGATMLATVSPRIAMLFGGSASAALESMSEAGNVYRSVISEKNAFMAKNSDVRLSPETVDQDASEAATKSFWANVILISLTNRFGVFNPDTAGFVRRVVMSSPIEGVQEAAQQIIQNFTQNSSGVGAEQRDLLEGTGESFVIGAIVGGLMGATVETVMDTGQVQVEGDQNILKAPGEGAPPETAQEAPGEAPPAETTTEPTPAAPAAPAPEQAQEEPAPAAPPVDIEEDARPPSKEGQTFPAADLPEELKPYAGSVVESNSGQDAVLANVPLSVFGSPKFETLNQKTYKPGEQKVVDPIDVVYDVATKEYTITDGANRFTQAQANGDQTIPAIVEVTRNGEPVAAANAGSEESSGFRIYISGLKGETAHPSAFHPVAGTPVDLGIPGVDHQFFIHRPVHAESGKPVEGKVGWVVSERSSGALISEGTTKEKAIESAKEKIQTAGPEGLAAAIDKYQKFTQANIGETASTPKKERRSSGGALAFNIKNFAEGALSKKGEVEVDKIVARSEIARQLSTQLGVPVRTGHFKEQALGIFKPWAHVVRLKSKLGDLRIPVLVHESAHFLDYTLFGQPKKGKAADDPKNWTTTKFVSNMIPRAELDPLLTEYGGTPNSKKREAFAEFVRYWVTEPAKALERAPQFSKIWEETILPDFPEVRDTLLTTRADWARWNDMPAVAKVVSQISFGERSKSFADMKDAVVHTWNDLLAKWVDDLYPVKKFSDLAKEKGIKLDIEADPYILARLSRGWVGKANVFLEKGTFDVRFWKTGADGKAVPSFTGKGFGEILAPVHAKNATEDFSAYLVSRRAVDLNAREIHSGINTKDAEQALKDLAEKHPEFEKIAAELDDYQNALLDYIRHAGLLTKEGYERLRFEMKNYVPFFRVMEEAEAKGLGGRTLADLRSPIKRIKGSDRDIVNPLESIVKNTYALINAAERNRVGIAMVNLSVKHPELAQMFEKVPEEKTKVASVKINELIDQVSGKGGSGFAEMLGLDPSEVAKTALGQMGEEIVNIFRPSMIHDEGILTVMIDGKPQSFYADPEIYKAMQASEVEDIGVVWKLLSYPARWLRAGATLTPEFMVRNPARDMMSAFVYSEYGFMPPVDIARGLYGALSKDDAYWLWRMGGGEQAMLVSMDRTTLKKTYEDLAREHNITPKTVLQRGGKYVVNPLETLRLFSEFSEKMTRVGEAKKAISRGANPLEAAFSAREVTLDFAKIGSKARAFNMIVAFFNAQIQGSVRMVRAFREKPYRTTAKTLVGITLPSILLLMWNMQDPEWDEIPQWEKNLFWMIKIGDTWIRFPKPFELGILFGSLPERVIESIVKNDPNVFPELRKSITDGASPSILPTAIMPIIENVTNYSFFLDRNIVPDSLEALPAFAQYTSYTSETAKSIGKWLSYSPAKIDNLISGYFAGLGRYATEIIDKATAAIGGKEAPPAPPAPTAADLPIIKAFVVRDPVTASSESLNRFYIQAEEARAARNYYNDLIQGNKKEESQKWYADHMAEIALSPFYEDMRRTLATMRRLQNLARDSKTLTPEEKRTRIDELGAKMTELAHKAITITLKDETP